MKVSARKSMELVLHKYKDAVCKEGTDHSHVVMVPTTGTALSPVCPGQNGAWRWAALMIIVADMGHQFLLDETLEVDDEVAR